MPSRSSGATNASAKHRRLWLSKSRPSKPLQSRRNHNRQPHVPCNNPDATRDLQDSNLRANPPQHRSRANRDPRRLNQLTYQMDRASSKRSAKLPAPKCAPRSPKSTSLGRTTASSSCNPNTLTQLSDSSTLGTAKRSGPNSALRSTRFTVPISEFNFEGHRHPIPMRQPRLLGPRLNHPQSQHPHLQNRTINSPTSASPSTCQTTSTPIRRFKAYAT